MPSSPNTLLAVRNLARTAASGEQLLYPVSFSIHSGDLIVCQGASGAGKTVLLRSIARLDQSLGEVDWPECRIEDRLIPYFRSQVMYLPQRPQLPLGSVRDALEEPFAWHVHRAKRFHEATALAYLQALGQAESVLNASTRNLSEGELQIVALVRAMLLQPMILLLDEPTAAVDTDRTVDFEKVVGDWLEAGPRAILWVTHNAPQADRLATRRLQLKAGKVSVDV